MSPNISFQKGNRSHPLKKSIPYNFSVINVIQNLFLKIPQKNHKFSSALFLLGRAMGTIARGYQYAYYTLQICTGIRLPTTVTPSPDDTRRFSSRPVVFLVSSTPRPRLEDPESSGTLVGRNCDLVVVVDIGVFVYSQVFSKAC